LNAISFLVAATLVNGLSSIEFREVVLVACLERERCKLRANISFKETRRIYREGANHT